MQNKYSILLCTDVYWNWIHSIELYSCRFQANWLAYRHQIGGMKEDISVPYSLPEGNERPSCLSGTQGERKERGWWTNSIPCKKFTIFHTMYHCVKKMKMNKKKEHTWQRVPTLKKYTKLSFKIALHRDRLIP